MKQVDKKIAIVGSGFLGLTLALPLADAGHDVTVLNPRRRLEGLRALGRLVT